VFTIDILHKTLLNHRP